MEENYDYFGYRVSMEYEIYPNSEKNTDNENIKSDEQKHINTHVNNGINNPQNNVNNVNNINNNNYRSDLNDNLYYSNNNIVNIQVSNDKPNNVYNFSNEYYTQADLIKYYNKNINSNENYLNVGDIIQVNCKKYLEQNEINKKTSNTSNNTANINGKQIITNNEAMSVALNEMYKINSPNMENKHDMQFLKKKKRRRTKKEVEQEKLKNLNVKKIKKKLGRKLKIDNEKSEHTKKSDDNIMKKINSNFYESVRVWLNKSFLHKGKFLSLKELKKSGKMFLKINPQLITTNLKRKHVIDLMEQKFKDIFSKDVSKKYKNHGINKNRELIEEIYQQNQPFLIFILESTFTQIFNIFNGQTKEEEFKRLLLDKINADEETINEFINNFEKCQNFIKKIKNKLQGKESEEKIQDYIERIFLLCLNYPEWFLNKFDRHNKNKIIKEEEKEKNSNEKENITPLNNT